MTTKGTTWAGVGCLVIGHAVLPSPVSVGGNAADHVADAASDLPAMRWALQFDAPLLLLVSAVRFGQAIGCVLLAIELWRRRAVPRCAAVAVGAFPIVGLVAAPAGAALAVAGFAACALTLRRAVAKPSPADTSAPLTPART